MISNVLLIEKKIALYSVAHVFLCCFIKVSIVILLEHAPLNSVSSG